MRGSPILRLVLAALLLGAAGAGTAILTARPHPVAAPTASLDPATGSAALRIEGRSPVGPEFFRLRLGGAELLELRDPGTVFDSDAQLPGLAAVELLLEATWADPDAPAALQLRIFLDGKDQGVQTFWGEGSILDVLALDPANPQ